MSQFLPRGFYSIHHAAMVGNTSLAQKLVDDNPLLLFCVSSENYLPIHLALLARHFETFGFLLTASQDHIDKCKQKENHSPFEGNHGAVLLNFVIDAGLIEVAYGLIKAYYGIGTTKYENVKHALLKAVENFDLFSRLPKEFRNLDQSLAKNLQLELRNTKDQGEQQYFPESEVKDHKPVLLLRTLCNQLRKQNTRSNTRCIFMEAAIMAVRLDIKEALNELTLHFPDAIRINHEGHYLTETVVSYGSNKVVNFQANKNSDNMIDLQSDPDDNNILHQAAMLAPYEEANKKSNAASRLHAEVMRFKKVESLLHPMYKEAKNKNGETPMMVFKREHEELRKHAEMLIFRKAKVNIIAAVLIVVIIIATLIKYMIENDIITFLETKVLLFTIWGAIINLTANISYVMFFLIITSPFEVEDFELLPSRVNRARTMMLFSLISLLVACGVLLLISFPQQLFLMFARILPGIVAFSFIPACWFMWSKLKILLFQKERVKMRGGAMYKLVGGHDPNHDLESIRTM